MPSHNSTPGKRTASLSSTPLTMSARYSSRPPCTSAPLCGLPRAGNPRARRPLSHDHPRLATGTREKCAAFPHNEPWSDRIRVHQSAGHRAPAPPCVSAPPRAELPSSPRRYAPTSHRASVRMALHPQSALPRSRLRYTPTPPFLDCARPHLPPQHASCRDQSQSTRALPA